MTMMTPLIEAPPVADASAAAASRGRHAERHRSEAGERFGAMVDDALATIGRGNATDPAEHDPSVEERVDRAPERELSDDHAAVSAGAVAAAAVTIAAEPDSASSSSDAASAGSVAGIDAIGSSTDHARDTAVVAGGNPFEADASADDGAEPGILPDAAITPTVADGDTGMVDASAAARGDGALGDTPAAPADGATPTGPAAAPQAAPLTSGEDGARLHRTTTGEHAPIAPDSPAGLAGEGRPSTDVDGQATTVADTEADAGLNASTSTLDAGAPDAMAFPESPRGTATDATAATPDGAASPDAAPDLAMDDPGEPWQQVARAMHSLRRDADGAQRMTIRLDPPELGTVEVEVQVRAGRISVHALVDSPTTRDALVRALPELRASLEEAGLGTDTLDVGTRSSGDRSGDGEPAAPDHPHGRIGAGASPVTRRDAADASRPKHHVTDNANRLDLRL